MSGAVLRPENADAVAEAIRDASGPLAIEGGGGLKGFGRPAQTDATLKLDALQGVVEYSPTELYATFRAGTTLADAKAVLAEKKQRLPFDPPDLTGLYAGAGAGGPATVGGVAAAGLSGPARVAAGACRDYLIGVHFVDGQGQQMHGGGKVMKNVTGYDLCKLTTGAFGGLGAITDVTFKVLPIAPAEVTLCLLDLDDRAGQSALAGAFNSPFEPMAAAHLPLGGTIGGIAGLPAGRAVSALRLEAFPDSLAYRKQAIRAHLPKDAEIIELETDVSAAFWRAVRDVAPFQAPDTRPLWRISTAPTAGPGVVAAIKAILPADAVYDWAGGLIWLAVAAEADDAGAAIVRQTVQQAGGHATLVRAQDQIRAAIDVFEPLSPPLAVITKGLKREFDPRGILNPGRMYAGI